MSPDSIDNTTEGCRILASHCALLRPGESALVVSDRHTRALGHALASAAREIVADVRHSVVAPFSAHGQEPPSDVAEQMRQASVVFGITQLSMAHTAARLKATLRGTRYLSLPDYTQEVLASGALRTDFMQIAPEADWLADSFTRAESIRVTSKLGTDLSLDVRGRTGNSAPGVCRSPGSIASPPDAESNVSPVEDGSNGVLIVDGSIPCPDLGLLRSAVTLTIENGQVVEIQGDQAHVVADVLDRLGDPRTRIVAEFGVGLNPEARLSGSMLEDEGCRGTCHVGLGSNVTIGGRNQVAFHLDFVVRDVRVEADGVTLSLNPCMLEEESCELN